MADVHNSEQRSANMRAIRHKDTNPEVKIRRLLFAQGFRFRIHVKSLPGSPDIVLPKYRVAIFVQGCFWHGHGCHLFKVPATRTEFWMGKIQSNCDRDRQNEEKLLATGWRIITVWECALKGRLKRPLNEIASMLSIWIIAQDIEDPLLNISHI
jgi:DNA mismatch endonuclease (patch repair protein)